MLQNEVQTRQKGLNALYKTKPDPNQGLNMPKKSSILRKREEQASMELAKRLAAEESKQNQPPALDGEFKPKFQLHESIQRK